MHLRTHVRAEHRGRYTHGDSEYIDGMIEHDDTVGTLLKALDDMGIADNTIVVYSSDNGPHMNTWPDGAMTRFRSREEHQLGRRLPRAVPGPLAGRDQARHGDQRADEPQRLDSDALLRSPASRTSSASCKAGYTANGINYKVHLDGYDQSAVPDATSAAPPATTTARRAPARSSSTPTTTACSWPCARATTSTSSRSSACRARCGVWAEPFTTLRLQKIFNLMQDPFERADITSNTFWDWQLNHVGQVYGAMDDVGGFVMTFKDFPPRSFPPSFVPATILEETLDDIKDNKAKAGERAKSIDKIRSGVNQMIDQQLQQRGIK